MDLENQTHMSACGKSYFCDPSPRPCNIDVKYTGNPFGSFFSTVEKISSLVNPGQGQLQKTMMEILLL